MNEPSSSAPQVALLVDGAWNGEENCERCRDVRIDPEVVGLAEAVARVDIWDGCEASVVARPDPPAVAVIGYLTQTALENLDTVGWQIRDLLPRTRVLDYPAIEELVERLAARMTDTLGIGFIESAAFTAIPRGGHIVLGMLSYVLGLHPGQIWPGQQEGQPVVVVDDVAVTGHRFGETLRQLGGREVVFAHLLSHPDLRSAIEHAEPSVTACVSADDLHDHGPAHLGASYAAWRNGNITPRRYWIGLTDHVVTPWGETNVGLWQESPEDARLGIQLAGASSLRGRWSGEEPRLPVRVQQRGKFPVSPSDHTLFGRVGDEVVVGRSDGGPVSRLSGLGAEVWMTIVRWGDPDVARSRLDLSADDAEEFDDLVRSLLELGLLKDGREKATS